MPLKQRPVRARKASGPGPCGRGLCANPGSPPSRFCATPGGQAEGRPPPGDASRAGSEAAPRAPQPLRRRPLRPRPVRPRVPCAPTATSIPPKQKHAAPPTAEEPLAHCSECRTAHRKSLWRPSHPVRSSFIQRLQSSRIYLQILSIIWLQMGSVPMSTAICSSTCSTGSNTQFNCSRTQHWATRGLNAHIYIYIYIYIHLVQKLDTKIQYPGTSRLHPALGYEGDRYPHQLHLTQHVTTRVQYPCQSNCVKHVA